ncbi:HPF/RaiA family ribosome-associated protein [Pseudomonas argentinensis]|uniref:Ribosome-associated translation inhibitor RaiA n=1 Tax=Phytopseudomonas argentinensis TaxID=289370 RepID=A0A1I3I070_9GAMM|nr:HPF/RaiA family ribosome-associated protein [Pseudomonas argentinensis]KAB0548028.1 HPF/RaiA family ribosome-associated protein [Pseudomonas argentinensis]SFI41230.1 Ribosome-associated translation inhibitor RaiA [Pseudomonas argentinensis]
MQVHVNSNHIEGSARLQEWVSASVADRLERYEEFLSRVEVHVSDENGGKGGADDKRCQIEARPKGHQPLSVTHKAESLEQAIEGAAEKMRHALEHLVGKLESKPVATGHLEQQLEGDEVDESADALLQEEFLQRQEALGKD